MASIQLFITLLAIGSIFKCHANNNVTETASGVTISGTGEVDLIFQDKLTFFIAMSCKGNFTLCYATKEGSVNDRYENVKASCPPNSCALSLDADLSYHSSVLLITTDNGRAFATFDEKNKEFCPLNKVNGRQRFTILDLPNCPVTVVGAKLPPVEQKTEPEKHEDGEKEAQTVTSTKEPEEGLEGKLMWIIPSVMGGILLLAVIGTAIASAYYYCNWCSTEKAEVPVQMPGQQQPTVAPKSPAPAPAPSPMIVPPVSPQVTVVSKPQLTDAMSQSIVTPPPQEVHSRGERVKKEKKARPTSTTIPTVADSSATKTSTAKDISPRYEVEVKRNEDPLKQMRRLGMIIYKGVIPCHSGSRQDPFEQQVYAIYAPFAEPRDVVDWEVDFFHQITSDAMKDIDALLKTARQELCRHGAVFSHRRMCSFNKVTYHYIKRKDTPGFVAWYAFACEHGGGLRINDDKEGDAILKDMSVPVLLTVFFREDLEIEVRRKAYTYIRRYQLHLASMYPLHQLRGMFYPVSLIPALIKKNRRLFLEGADDATYSTPYEQMKQIRKYRASLTEDLDKDEVDETQVTYSDGKKRDVIGDVTVLGTELTPTTTIHESLF